MKNRLTNEQLQTDLSGKSSGDFMPPEMAKVLAQMQGEGKNVSVMQLDARTPQQFITGLATMVEQAAQGQGAPIIKILDDVDDQMNLPTGAYVDIMIELAKRDLKTEKETGVKFEDESLRAVSFLRFAAKRIGNGEVCACCRCAAALVFQYELVDGMAHEDAMKKSATIINELREKAYSESQQKLTTMTNTEPVREDAEDDGSFAM